jgi:hypothetical protein
MRVLLKKIKNENGKSSFILVEKKLCHQQTTSVKHYWILLTALLMTTFLISQIK